MTNTHSIRAGWTRITRSRRIRQTHATRAAFVKLAITIVVDEVLTSLRLWRHFAITWTIRRALGIAVLRSTVTDTNAIRTRRSGVTRRSRVRQTNTTHSFFIGLSVAIVIGQRQTRFCERSDFTGARAVRRALGIA